MKELDIPYIGVKIEALPTILRKVREAFNDSEFIDYYKGIGKASKTASEYLASLRNLNLAKRKDKSKTVLLPAGIAMIEEDIQLLYSSLLRHCLKQFPDLRIVKECIIRKNITTLNKLVEELSLMGYKIRRKQTLSSYLKLIIEGDKNAGLRAKEYISYTYKHEKVEFNQFLKLLMLFSKQNPDKIVIGNFYNWLNERVILERNLFIEYLKTLKMMGKYKLIEVNSRVLKNEDDGFNLNGKLYYYLEIIK